MNADPPSDSAVDFAHLERFRANPAGLRELVRSFLSTAPDLLHELDQCFQQRDKDNATNLLHALAGAALSTGAVPLAEACKRLARAWEQLDSTAELPFASLRSEVENAREALRSFLEELPAGGDPLPPAPGARPITILHVEDNASARALVRLALESDHFAILEAADGREALALAAREAPDLAIVDLNLGPGGPDSPSGFDLLQRLRDRIPAIVLTVDQRPESIRRAAAAGAWGYLLKSPNTQNLRATVEMTLARSREAWRDSPSNALDIATGWLMATFRFDRESARQTLVNFATEQRRRTLEVAQDIVTAHDFQTCLERFATRQKTCPTDAEP